MDKPGICEVGARLHAIGGALVGLWVCSAFISNHERSCGGPASPAA